MKKLYCLSSFSDDVSMLLYLFTIDDEDDEGYEDSVNDDDD